MLNFESVIVYSIKLNLVLVTTCVKVTHSINSQFYELLITQSPTQKDKYWVLNSGIKSIWYWVLNLGKTKPVIEYQHGLSRHTQSISNFMFYWVLNHQYNRNHVEYSIEKSKLY